MSLKRRMKSLEGRGMKTAWDMREFKTPATRYPDVRVGKARLKTCRYNGVYECYGLKGFDFYVAEKLPVKVLQIRGKTWMVDDPPHWWAMEEHASHYRGRVLVAGLGLGLIVHALARNPGVTGIRVIERERDVIEMIAPHLPDHPGLDIVHGDFFQVQDDPDGVFYDLFVGEGEQLVDQATSVYLGLVCAFPTARVVRVHGFDNDRLEGLGQMIRAAREMGRREFGL